MTYDEALALAARIDRAMGGPFHGHVWCELLGPRDEGCEWSVYLRGNEEFWSEAEWRAFCVRGIVNPSIAAEARRRLGATAAA